MDSECLSLAVITMNDANYLKTIPRQTTEEREAFRTKYGLTAEHHCEHVSPAEWFETHSHHAESHDCEF